MRIGVMNIHGNISYIVGLILFRDRADQTLTFVFFLEKVSAEMGSFLLMNKQMT